MGLSYKVTKKSFGFDKEKTEKYVASAVRSGTVSFNKHPCVIPVFGRPFPDPDLHSLHSGTVQMAEMVLKSEYFTITKTRLQ